METINIGYTFTLPDKTKEIFDLRLDAKTLKLQSGIMENLPSWTRLDFHQCPHCPLNIDLYPDCPLSVNLVSIVERLGVLISFDKIHVEVSTKERTVSRSTTAQQGISSLMGLVIAISECPHTDFLKPMARFHLPFADEEETIWRATSTYLLAQYFLILRGHRIDLELEGLTRIYHNIEKLNFSIVKRLRTAGKKDSTINALVHLDVFAKYIKPGVEESLDKIRHIFTPFLHKQIGA
ncbi:MAG: hypothetical protein HKO79_13440 [Desulfobacterales bacterium]|nr:hypothetical protein [Deltaproteobacteria bacterium]NNL43486.1 hypothetical protein [Desulfobacterales bacterium]